MRRSLSYFTSTTINLCLIDFYNAGLTKEDTKRIIKSIPDPGHGYLNLRCYDSGLGGYWSVETSTSSEIWIENIVKRIEFLLELELAKLKATKKEVQ